MGLRLLPTPSEPKSPVGQEMEFDNVKPDHADRGKLNPRYVASFVLRNAAGDITHIRNVNLDARSKEDALAEVGELPTIYWTGGTKVLRRGS